MLSRYHSLELIPPPVVHRSDMSAHAPAVSSAKVRIECQEQMMTFVHDAPLPLPGMPHNAPALPAFPMTR